MNNTTQNFCPEPKNLAQDNDKDNKGILQMV